MTWLQNFSLNKEKRVYQGIVRTGRGGAAAGMSEPSLLETLHSLIGFQVVPGTLNIKLLEPIDLPFLRYLKLADVGWDFDPAKYSINYQGEIGVYYRRITVAKKYPACFQEP